MSSFEDRIKILVTAKAKHIASKRIEHIRKRIVEAAKLWRRHIKKSLSRPYPGGRNTTDTPYMRSGRLRDSVPRYNVTTLKTFNGNKLDLGQTVISMKRAAIKPAWASYGSELDRSHQTLSGWQERAYRVLYDVIDARLSNTRDYLIF